LSHRPYQKSARHRASCIEATTLGLDIRFVAPARYHSIRCDGASYPTGPKTRKAGASRSTRSARPLEPSLRSERLIISDEWNAIKGQKAKRPYAIAMKDGSPFGIGGLWENWHDPTSSEWIRTFAIITTDANELVAEIHDRMPLILAPVDYTRWLSDEPDPGDLMRPFPAEPMRMWPISTRVNKPENDDPSVVEPIEVSAATA
jgi:putative SOS response-associated peptidase YedK